MTRYHCEHCQKAPEAGAVLQLDGGKPHCPTCHRPLLVIEVEDPAPEKVEIAVYRDYTIAIDGSEYRGTFYVCGDKLIAFHPAPAQKNQLCGTLTWDDAADRLQRADDE